MLHYILDCAWDFPLKRYWDYDMPKIERKPRINARRYKDLFVHARYIPFLRARAQCDFRKEEFLLTFEDWCEFWPTPELWSQRGRAITDLTLMRIDPDLPWHRDNCCVIERGTQLNIKNKRRRGFAWEHLLEGARYV